MYKKKIAITTVLSVMNVTKFSIIARRTKPMLDLTDPKSKKLAVLSEMLGLDWRDTRKEIFDDDLDEFIDNENYNLPMAITMSLGDLSWAVRDKMVEMGLGGPWLDAIGGKALACDAFEETPESWIEAGITVYEGSKT